MNECKFSINESTNEIEYKIDGEVSKSWIEYMNRIKKSNPDFKLTKEEFSKDNYKVTREFYKLFVPYIKDNKLSITEKIDSEISSKLKGKFNTQENVVKSQPQIKSKFKGYVGGFNSSGKGTEQGDGKDKAMRQVADGFIGEIVKSDSSSATSKREIENKNQYYEGNIKPEPNTVFVFGSNPEGRHGAGAAKIAKEQFGAVYGQGEGLQGNAYALPTKDLRIKENKGLKSISPEQITESIKKLYEVAKQNPNKKFKVAYRNTTETSLNGYTGLEMIEMFNQAGIIPSNVVFSKEWVSTGLLGSKQDIEGFQEYIDNKLNVKNNIVMLARNSEFKGQPLKEETKQQILQIYNNGAVFVVGDTPGVDSQFIDYLQEIKAEFQIYHTGDTPRIQVQNATNQVVNESKLLYNQQDTKQSNQTRTIEQNNKEVFDKSLPKINIYAGTNENANLSNFAIRPFTFRLSLSKLPVKFQSVEQAFQYNKLEYTKDNPEDNSNNTQIAEQMRKTTNGAELRQLGKSITGFNSKDWDNNSSIIMKQMLKESFQSNPNALQELLNTNDSELTHTQDKGKWGKEFPKLLMEVRQELQPNTQFLQSNQSVTLLNNIDTNSLKVGDVIKLNNIEEQITIVRNPEELAKFSPGMYPRFVLSYSSNFEEYQIGLGQTEVEHLLNTKDLESNIRKTAGNSLFNRLMDIRMELLKQKQQILLHEKRYLESNNDKIYESIKEKSKIQGAISGVYDSLERALQLRRFAKTDEEKKAVDRHINNCKKLIEQENIEKDILDVSNDEFGEIKSKMSNEDFNLLREGFLTPRQGENYHGLDILIDLDRMVYYYKLRNELQNITFDDLPFSENIQYNEELDSRFETTDSNVYESMIKVIENLSNKLGVPYEIDETMNVGGRFKNGKVYFNPNKMTKETPFHEFSHPFIHAVKRFNPELYNNLVNEIYNTPYGQSMMKEVQELYSDKSKEIQEEEAIVELIARYSTGRINENDITNNKSLWDKLIEFLRSIGSLIFRNNSNDLAKQINVASEEELFQNPIRIYELNNNLSLKELSEILKYGGVLIKTEGEKRYDEDYERVSNARQWINNNEDVIKEYHLIEQENNNLLIEYNKLLETLEGMTNSITPAYFDRINRYLRNKYPDNDYAIYDSNGNYTNYFNSVYSKLTEIFDKDTISYELLNSLESFNEDNVLKGLDDILNSSNYEDSIKFNIDLKKQVYNSLISKILNDVDLSNKLDLYTNSFDIKTTMQNISKQQRLLYDKLNRLNKIAEDNTQYNIENFYDGSLVINYPSLEDLKEYQFIASDLNGVYHNVGAFMNNAGIDNVDSAISNIVNLLNNNISLDLVSYSGLKGLDGTPGLIRLKFKDNTPIRKSYKMDIYSTLDDNKYRYTDKYQDRNILTSKNISELVEYNENEFESNERTEHFVDLNKNNLDSIYLINGYTDLSNELKQLADLTGANILNEQGEVLYQPNTIVPFQDEIYDSRFDTQINDNVKELDNTLLNILNEYNIIVDSYDLNQMKDKFGVNTLGVFDILNKTVSTLNEDLRNITSIPNVFSYAFFELMGTSFRNNKEYKELIDLVPYWENYQDIYNQYYSVYQSLSGKPSNTRIKKEAIAKALSEALINYYNNSPKIIDENQKGIVNKIIKLIKSLIEKFKYLLDYDNNKFKSKINNLAEQILTGKHSSKLMNENNTEKLLTFEETIENQNKEDDGRALEFMQLISKNKGIIVGSLAIRKQGTVYRNELDSLHDIDIRLNTFNVFGQNIDSGEITSEMFEQSELFKNLKDTYGENIHFFAEWTNLSDDYRALHYFLATPENAEKLMNSPERTLAKKYSSLDKETQKEIILIDFFVSNSKVKYIVDETYGLNLSHFTVPFYYKQFGMGREKDVFDYQNLKIYDTDNRVDIYKYKNYYYDVSNTIDNPSYTYQDNSLDSFKQQFNINGDSSIVTRLKEEYNAMKQAYLSVDELNAVFSNNLNQMIDYIKKCL